ncbi:aldo/keto reductase [Guptibacillus hwajinpoensis]|uniref:aldo/keto reductase n=1 Tax=Guptibacillus hwajinpoensis TaxID=208199 RepID=UPI001CFEC54F|nr:aldo/keto reductase [Pseudalkalibacillus hwajinpoensis]WLR58857.1 aldo/keto reductase [Pseudalkalibacillus hwajinpoensis]
MISGYASLSGTREFISKFDLSYRQAPMFYTSPIAIGTHLGEMNEIDSALYRQGIEYGVRNGLNFIDTAINYRGMRSERDVGYVLKSLVNRGIINRDEVIISTKGGIIPGDVEAKLVPKEYLRQILLKGNVINESDLNIVDTHRHVLTPTYYQFAIDKSKHHLNVKTIDIYYVHNPEISMMTLGSEKFYNQLWTLFSLFEEQVQSGRIKYYGFATWFGLTNEPEEKGYISLEEVVNVAKNVAGNDNHFKFIQFPLNQQMDASITKRNQKVNGEWLPVLRAAKNLGLLSTTSAPFNLGKLIDKTKDIKSILLEVTQHNEILSTMVGMKKIEHIKDNIQTFKRDF